MKTFLLLLVTTLMFACSSIQPKQFVASDVGKAIITATTDAAPALIVSASQSSGVLSQADDPPNANIGDVINIPKKDAGTSAWVYWSLGVFIVAYSYISNKIPTAKSYTILAMLYKLFNYLWKDRANNNKIFDIVPVPEKPPV